MAHIPSILPQSPLWEIRQTPTTGRAVFALQALKAGTQVLSTSELPASVVLRPYKREVCAHCFHYNQGEKLPHYARETGFYFCTPKCKHAWQEGAGEVGLQAWERVEEFVKAKNLKRSGLDPVTHEMPDADASVPSAEDVRRAWTSVESTAHFVREARAGSGMKPHRRAVEAVLCVNPNTDVLSFQLSGILSRANGATAEWESLMNLVPDYTPYKNDQELRAHIQSYLHLLCLAPVSLLPSITPVTLISLSERDSHNSFGIRSLDDDGDEFFGYGVWPVASFFNHSCGPNVGKKREGRNWVFWALKDVREGEELCITYLGGDEVSMLVKERRVMTLGVWQFVCGCSRCLVESEEEMVMVVNRGTGVTMTELVVTDLSGVYEGNEVKVPGITASINEINWMNGYQGMNVHD
jgi:hypothetical protein